MDNTETSTVFFRTMTQISFRAETKGPKLYRLNGSFLLRKGFPDSMRWCPAQLPGKQSGILGESGADMLEYIQHGWSHTRYERGEFDKSRSYDLQKEDILKTAGKLWRIYLGRGSFPLFPAPYGVYTPDTIRILNEEAYHVLSSSRKLTHLHRYFDAAGCRWAVPFS